MDPERHTPETLQLNDTHMSNLRRETATQCRDDRQRRALRDSSGAGGKGEERDNPQSARSERSEMANKMPRGEVEYAITNYSLQVFFPHLASCAERLYSMGVWRAIFFYDTLFGFVIA